MRWDSLSGRSVWDVLERTESSCFGYRSLDIKGFGTLTVFSRKA